MKNNKFKINVNLNDPTLCKKLCMFSLIMFIVSLGAQVYLSNVAVIKTKNLKDLFVEKQEVEKDIALLKFQTSELSSLSSLETRALALGFVKMNEPLALVSQAPLASLTHR